MPVVINRNEPGGDKPDKKTAGAAKSAAKSAAKTATAAKNGKSAKAKAPSGGFAEMDDRLKLAGLGIVIVLALVALFVFTGGFGLFGQAAPPPAQSTTPTVAPVAAPGTGASGGAAPRTGMGGGTTGVNRGRVGTAPGAGAPGTAGPRPGGGNGEGIP